MLLRSYHPDGTKLVPNKKITSTYVGYKVEVIIVSLMTFGIITSLDAVIIQCNNAVMSVAGPLYSLGTV